MILGVCIRPASLTPTKRASPSLAPTVAGGGEQAWIGPLGFGFAVQAIALIELHTQRLASRVQRHRRNKGQLVLRAPAG